MPEAASDFRTWNYPPGYNVNFQPKKYTYTFQQLHDNFDLLRQVIEGANHTSPPLKWDIVSREGEDVDEDATKAIKEFLRYVPTGNEAHRGHSKGLTARALQWCDAHYRTNALATALKATDLAPQRFYLPELDSLRFFAFLSVFVAHNTKPGFVHHFTGHGVDLFFALSAYLLTELMLREKEQNGRLDIKAFYTRRALRIWPLYFGFLSAVFVIWCVVGIPGIPAATFPVFAFCLRETFSTSLVLPSSMVIVSLWSISLEEQIYLLWPHLVQRLSRRSIAAAGAAFWFALIVGRLQIFADGRGVFWLALLTHLDSVACGIVIAGLLSPATKLPCGLFCFGIAAWAFGSSYEYVANPAPIPMTLAFAAIGAGSGALLLSVIKVAWLRNSVTVYLGQISYGLYIFHGAALLLGTAAFGRKPVSCIVALAATIAIAAASYRWFERPFLRLKKRFQRPPSRPV